MVIISGKNIKELTGEVVSNKMDKTIVVSVERVKIHPIYKKRFTVRKKFYAHDEANKAQIGDKVKIREDNPRSKLKRWSLIDVIA